MKLLQTATLLFCFFSILPDSSTKAQAPMVRWSSSLDGSLNEEISVIKAFPGPGLQATYIGGSFEGTAILNGSDGRTSTITSNGGKDAFFARLDPDGNLDWIKTMGGSGNDEVTDLVIDHQNGLYLLGEFESSVDFDPDTGTLMLSSAGGKDAFVLRLDASGNLNWVKRIGNSQNIEANALNIDTAGSVMLVGAFRGTLDVDPGSNDSLIHSAGLTDVYAIRLTKQGVFDRVIHIGGPDDSEGIELQALWDLPGYRYTESQWTLMCTARDSMTVFIGDEPGMWSTSKKYFSQKGTILYELRGNGLFQVNPHPEPRTFQKIVGTALSCHGNKQMTGYFTGTVKFNPGFPPYERELTSKGGKDAFLLHMGANAGVLDVAQLGGPGDDVGESIYWDVSNTYILGSFADSIDLDPDTVTTSWHKSVGGKDVFLYHGFRNLTVPASLDYDWGFSIGSNGLGDDEAKSIYAQGGKVYASCIFRDSLFVMKSPMERDHLSAGQVGGLCFMVDSCRSRTNLFLKSCGPMVSPSGSKTWSSSGVYKDTLQNAQGCDSVIYVSLAVGSGPSYDSSSVFACDTFFSPSGNYWTIDGIYVDTLMGPTGCDSVLEYHLSLGTSSIDTIDTTVCSRYFSPSGRFEWESSGVYFDTLLRANSCDSIIRFDLDVLADRNISLNGSSLVSNASGAGVTYQWLDCDNGMAAITGENRATFTPTGNGSYALAVGIFKTQCKDTSDCFSVNSVGFPYLHRAARIHVFPNPTEDMLHVRSGLDVNAFVLMDMQGRVLRSKEVSSKSFDLIMPEQKGIYIVLIFDEYGNKTPIRVVRN